MHGSRCLAVGILLALLFQPLTASAAEDTTPHTLWLEAESFGPLKGLNFSYQPVEQTTKGSWSVSGPGVAAEWTQGGESEWMSIAARADEPGEIVVSRSAEAPAAGAYTLWVRYADYRGKKETFGVRVRQGAKTFSHMFGDHPVVDELDPMKVLWDWAFGWDHVPVALEKGPLQVELYTTGPTEARRQVDCVCLTTDSNYHPFGREKPDRPIWKLLRELRTSAPEPEPADARSIPQAWKIASRPPVFLWNTAQPWLDELKKTEKRMEWPFNCDPSLTKDFLAAYAGKQAPVFGAPLSGPTIHIPLYPAVFQDSSGFLQWLGQHPDRNFSILLNYGEPAWPKEANRKAVYQNLQKLSSRFLGYVAGESLSYDAIDQPALDAKIRAAHSRGEVLEAMRESHTAATIRKFSDYAGVPLSAEQAWGPVIPCQSAGMEALAHALANWGCARIGHESTGNSPTLARRLAFLRGAARQFGVKVLDYQSCNLGDASTIFARDSFFYPASSRYILDNQYDAWAGSGTNWVLKDYLLFYLAGADAFYHEEGNDIFWKPGGNSAGDAFPVRLSPRGTITEAVMRLVESHPRATQYTPVAFLLDEAHGYSQEFFQPGAFGLDPQLNPSVLAFGRHQDSIRGWFDIAYFPAPETQNEPASAIRQTYVNGMFGDLFDVIVAAPRHERITSTYRTIIAAGDVSLSDSWGKALADYLQQGGTLVVCSGQFSGPGASALGLPKTGASGEASGFRWDASGDRCFPSNVFRFESPEADGAHVLASTPDGRPLVVSCTRGKGNLIYVGIPLGLGIDSQPASVLAMVMRQATRNLVPIHVTGDVEWTLSRLDDGAWLVGLFNNRGINKPQHGVNATDFREERDVQLTRSIPIAECREWITHESYPWPTAGEKRSTLHVLIPAGAVRLLECRPTG